MVCVMVVVVGDSQFSPVAGDGRLFTCEYQLPLDVQTVLEISMNL